MGDQPGRLAVQELWKTWKLHAKLLAENRSIQPATEKKVTKASDLKIDQLRLIKNHLKGPFDPTYICARAQSISQCVDAGQLNIPPQQ